MSSDSPKRGDRGRRRRIPRRRPKDPSARRPRRSRKYRGLNAARMVEDALLRPIDITVGGRKQRRSVYYAIVIQLAAKSATNNKRAIRVLGKYRDYAAKHGSFNGVRLVFKAPPAAGRR